MMAGRGREAALQLYRTIRRAHRQHLPSDMRQLGDAYVKAEFQLHKKVEKPEQLDQFFSAWEQYLKQLLQTARAKQSISTGSLDDMGSSSSSAAESLSARSSVSSSAATSFGKDLPQDMDLSSEQQSKLEDLRKEAFRAGKSE